MNEAELSKAEQELVEKIAQREAELHRVYYNRKYGYHPWDKLPPTLKAEIYEKADYFISLFNEALPELAKANGYVKLDIDQSIILPEISDEERATKFGVGYSIAIQDLIKAGWRKVIQEVKDGS